MDRQQEQWRPLNGDLAGLPYEISDQGRFRSTATNKILSQGIASNGYARVCVCKGTVRSGRCYRAVHRLVLSAFDRPPVGDFRVEQCNHIDGNKLNNCIENLEWVS